MNDSDERDAHRQDSESNPCGAPGGQPASASYRFRDGARDVFDDDNRIVNHESRSNGQRHEREIVQRVPQ